MLFTHRALLTYNVTLAIPRPSFPEADLRAMLRLVGIENRLHFVDMGGFMHLDDGPVTVLDWTERASFARVIPFRRPCIERLRTAVLALASSLASNRPLPAPALIVICRPQRSSRAWADEAVVLAALAERPAEEGLQLVRFVPHEGGDSLSLEKRLALFSRAAVVVFAHGGAAYHIMACAAGTRVVELTVPQSPSMDL